MDKERLKAGDQVKVDSEVYTVESICWETKRVWLKEIENWVYLSDIQE